MSNILNVTNAIPGYENNIKNNPYTTVETNIPNQVDPSKVIRPDGRTDAGQDKNSMLGLNYESNFENFLQMVNTSPQLTQIFTELIFSGMNNLVEAGIGEDFAEQIASFFDMMKMSKEEALKFIKSQTNGAIKFKGSFFNLLRQVMNETTSVDLKASVLDFVKKYNDMTSSKHLLSNIEKNITDIEPYMFKNERQQLEELFTKMNLNAKPGNIDDNAQLLKNQIIPFLSQYITKTHDMGKIRELVSMLTFNTARYENGDMDALAQSFKRLMSFQGFNRRFQGADEENLLALLMNTDFEKAAGKNEWSDHFLNIVRMGMKGEAGLENKQVFENIMNGILLNESVYMPTLHLMLPIELNGNLMFSEMWIDPDARDESGGGSEESERKVKMMVKFDIKDVGFFDLIMLYGDGKADVQLYYPKRLESMHHEIEKGLNIIMANNHISFRSLILEQATGSKTLSEVFPKMYERKNTINVRI
ncbi:MAG: hypothetical protein RSA90_04440 [Lachnospiraceae bacterium]